MSTDNPELVKLLALIAQAHRLGGQQNVVIPCDSASEARALRRKFYRLASKLPPEYQQLAADCTFSLQGRRVEVRGKLQWQHVLIVPPLLVPKKEDSHATEDKSISTSNP